ncbi:MAG TPA: MG2 domain-containing protein, partial [Thermomicrobiaceae bacterium]|nr:MG2 domain-containing protein [Thermomicrobiaceae bacterium]
MAWARRVSRRVFLTASAGTVGTVMAASGAYALLGRDEGHDPPPTPSATPQVFSGGTPTPATLPLARGPADGYLALAPKRLRSGQREQISLALFRGDDPVAGEVALALLKDGQPVAGASGQVAGRGALELALPALAPGDYQLQLKSGSLSGQAAIPVEDGTLVFVESDKPIYQPGQTIHLRVLALDAALRPAAGQVTVEVSDAKGIKVFKQGATVDDFGMAAVDLPLSDEPNLGSWSVRATLGQRQGEAQLRVERYVLPKYEVTLQPAKSWVLAGEPLKGTVSAEYS